MIAKIDKSYLPAAGRDWALPLYDPMTTFLGINQLRKSLLEGADLDHASRVLDIGCGTGTLAIAIKQHNPHFEIVGVDPDPKALERARHKSRRASAEVEFSQGFSQDLPYPDCSFDRIFSSFMFHHVPDEAKPQMLREAFRVLQVGASIHMLDVARISDGEHGMSAMLHMSRHLTQNSDPQILRLLQHAGFADARMIESRKILFGTVRVAYFIASRVSR